MARSEVPWPASWAFFWPSVVAVSAGAWAQRCAELALGFCPDTPVDAPRWATRNKIVLELPSVRLRSFAAGPERPEGVPTLICAPFALHGATVADFAPGHSLVGALQNAGLRHVFVTDWYSATTGDETRSIDSYLADLNRLVDELGGHVDLIGLCQGGWMALVYAARFPAKTRKLVLAGAPVDIAAGTSCLSRMARNTPTAVFEQFVLQGGGCVRGSHMLHFWGSAGLGREEIRDLLQIAGDDASPCVQALEARFRKWNAFTVDLPGAYYLEVVERLFKQNQLATGRFVALGQRIDLSRLRAPLFLIAARDDELVAPEQEMSVAHLLGTPPRWIETRIVPGGHLSLFMGARTLETAWPEIGRWLAAAETDLTATGEAA